MKIQSIAQQDDFDFDVAAFQWVSWPNTDFTNYSISLI